MYGIALQCRVLSCENYRSFTQAQNSLSQERFLFVKPFYKIVTSHYFVYLLSHKYLTDSSYLQLHCERSLMSGYNFLIVHRQS